MASKLAQTMPTLGIPRYFPAFIPGNAIVGGLVMAPRLVTIATQFVFTVEQIRSSFTSPLTLLAAQPFMVLSEYYVYALFAPGETPVAFSSPLDLEFTTGGDLLDAVVGDESAYGSVYFLGVTSGNAVVPATNAPGANELIVNNVAADVTGGADDALLYVWLQATYLDMTDLI